MSGEPLAAAIADALEPLVRRLVREEVRRAGLAWHWRTPEQAGELLGISAAADGRELFGVSCPPRSWRGGCTWTSAISISRSRTAATMPARNISSTSGPSGAVTAPALTIKEEPLDRRFIIPPF